MPYCMKCGQLLPDGAQFCPRCGNAAGSSPETQRRTVYDGELHKCPNCGALLPAFAVSCPSCGYELRGVRPSSPVNELAKKLEEAGSVEEKIDLISNFYVPNTREDIFDFFIMAVSNLENPSQDTEEAWRSKLEQTYHKARFSFGSSPDFAYIDKLYGQTRTTVSKRRFSNFVNRHKTGFRNTLIVLLGLGCFLGAGISIASSKGEDTNPVAALFLLVGFFVFGIFMSLLMEDRENEQKKKRAKTKHSDGSVTVESDAEEYLGEHYEDAVEKLKEMGFKNVTAHPEKATKRTQHENEVSGVSIAGNADFEEGDTFSENAKVIVRYYARNC